MFFLKEMGEQIFNGNKYYSFSIVFSSKTRTYYTASKSTCNMWINLLRKAIGYKNFLDYYDMAETLGEGKFGLVRVGIHKSTNEKVAIKIIKKAKMTTKDLELMKSEIDIMKLCRHPNIVRLLDHFENSDYIFIVMEVLTGGDLNSYFLKNQFNFSEKKAAYVINQIACGLKYLHQYGIVHRDLKPENIILSDKTDNFTVKIMDFGLSKIMGPMEKAADGYGTLSFVAPEVLIRQPYNKQIDIWSLGVILYYMLTGTLPFDDETDNEEIIARLTVFNELKFPSNKWKGKSRLVRELITKCLIKDPEKRISIENILEDKWVKQII